MRCQGSRPRADHQSLASWNHPHALQASAAINASVLPVVERTASMTEQALEASGLRVPLLVLRGDGGSMSLDRCEASVLMAGSSCGSRMLGIGAETVFGQ